MKPIVWIYADAVMDRQCPNCRAPVNEYCRRADGHIRCVPCIKRMPRDDDEPPIVRAAIEHTRPGRYPELRPRQTAITRSTE